MGLQVLLGFRALKDLRDLQENKASMELEGYLTYLVSVGIICTHLEKYAYFPSVWTHPNGQKGQQFKFQIDCSANCRGLFILLNSAAGDVDLYGKEGTFPTIT